MAMPPHASVDGARRHLQSLTAVVKAVLQTVPTSPAKAAPPCQPHSSAGQHAGGGAGHRAAAARPPAVPSTRAADTAARAPPVSAPVLLTRLCDVLRAVTGSLHDFARVKELGPAAPALGAVAAAPVGVGASTPPARAPNADASASGGSGPSGGSAANARACSGASAPPSMQPRAAAAADPYTQRSFRPPLGLQAYAALNAAAELVAVLGLAGPLWPMVTGCAAHATPPPEAAATHASQAGGRGTVRTADGGGASLLCTPVGRRPLMTRLGVDAGWLAAACEAAAAQPLDARGDMAVDCAAVMVDLLFAPTLDTRFVRMYAFDLCVAGSSAAPLIPLPATDCGSRWVRPPWRQC